jgi:hypothetical protein
MPKIARWSKNDQARLRRAGFRGERFSAPASKNKQTLRFPTLMPATFRGYYAAVFTP